MMISETHSEKRKFGKAVESSANKKARREISKDCIPDKVFLIGDVVFVFASTNYDSVSVHIRRFKKYGKTYYPTPEGLSAVQLALSKNPNRFTKIYKKATKRGEINAVKGSSLHLENLGELLGFKRNAIIIGNMKSEFIADAWSNFSVFYVYSDLISPQIVGDTQASLLRIVRTKCKDRETISQYYDRPQYLPLVRHSFQTIQSELRLNSGDFVPFQRRGKTIGKEVLMTESRVASDVLSGENCKESVKPRNREGGKKLAQKAIDRVQSMVGKGQYKGKRKKQKKFISSKARKAELFYKDFDDGLKKRTEFLKESATVDMIGCIHSDLFHQDRLLLNLLDLKIKLIRSKPEFYLQGSEGFKVVLDHVSLFIRKVRVNPGVILGQVKALEKTSAKYHINRVLCKVYSIPKGSMSFIQDNIFSGQMPKKLLVGCVDNEAFHGAFSKSPYEFKHFNLNFIGVYVNGQPVLTIH
ncbi:uncharacterized protein F54H12.2 [Trichonephila clavipes]|nr:uncharacterized protein F54H12.2 [Trichonephila clavipes]